MSNLWDDIKPFVGKFAPMLGAAVGGPFGAVAGNIIGSALGIKDAKPEDIAAAIKTGTLNGDQILSLKQAEMNFQVQMEQMGITSVLELEKLAVQDRDSARQMAIKTGDIITPRILAGVVVVGWILIQWFLLRHTIPSEMREIIMRVLGTLDAALITVLTYYFGTSASSQEKNALLYKSTPSKE